MNGIHPCVIIRDIQLSTIVNYQLYILLYHMYHSIAVRIFMLSYTVLCCAMLCSDIEKKRWNLATLSSEVIFGLRTSKLLYHSHFNTVAATCHHDLPGSLRLSSSLVNSASECSVLYFIPLLYPSAASLILNLSSGFFAAEL